MRVCLVSLVSLFWIAGCAASEEAGDEGRRGKLGKADHVSGSCAVGDVCGGKSSGSCWCDDLCASYGDCCEDAADACGVDECEVGDDTTCGADEVCAAGPPDQCQPAQASCEPQDAAGSGLCEAFFGYRWNGSGCVGVSGCSCVGPDCSALALDFEACESAHAHCSGGGLSQVCGGLTGSGCPQGQFCNLGATCGAGGESGLCAAQPEFCTQIFDPVCGCDGQTYGNACMAHAAGVSVASFDACPQQPAADSCEGHCGGQSEDGSCWCDDLCTSYGDCCADVNVCD